MAMESRSGVILDVATASHVRGFGIGRRIIRHIEQMAITTGVRELKLVPTGTAVGFYEKLGYSYGENIVHRDDMVITTEIGVTP